MADFVPESWKERAHARHERATLWGRLQSARADDQFIQDMAAIESLRVVVEWCKARSLKVVFCRKAGGLYHPRDREIRINGRASPLHQLHLLLHEAGHFLIGSKEKTERFGMGYSNSDKEVKRSLLHRIDCVDEEFEAWHRGKKLGRRLGVIADTDLVEFNKTRAAMLKTYLLWGAKAPGYASYTDPVGDESLEEKEEEPGAKQEPERRDPDVHPYRHVQRRDRSDGRPEDGRAESAGERL
jgi:hypothetical protein